MTPEEIVDRIAGMSAPGGNSDPFDSDDTLQRLISESRRALSPRVRRQGARVYDHESRLFTRAMLRIQDAPTEDLREFARNVVDLLWGVGSAASKRDPRRLDRDKEWEGDTIEEVARLIALSSFDPFFDVKVARSSPPPVP